MARQLQASLERMLGNLETDQAISRKVSLALTRELAGNVPTVEIIAKHMATSVRSLQSVLKNERTTFKLLLAQTRQRLAEERLRDKSLSIGEVSFLIGFSEPSAFHRAFKKWTGYTPGDFRNSL